METYAVSTKRGLSSLPAMAYCVAIVLSLFRSIDFASVGISILSETKAFRAILFVSSDWAKATTDSNRHISEKIFFIY
jgi:hypothetical protein